MNSDQTPKIPKFPFLLLWVPQMSWSVWGHLLKQCPLRHKLVSRFSEVKALISDRVAANLAPTHILVDGNLVSESYNSVLAEIGRLLPYGRVTVVVPPEHERWRRVSDLPISLLGSNLLTIFTAEEFDAQLFLRNIQKSHLPSQPQASQYVSPCQILKYDDVTLEPDNELSQTIGTELATISASIHLDDSLLRDGYVPTSGKVHGKVIDEAHADDALEVDHAACLIAWQQRAASISSFAAEVIQDSLLSSGKASAEGPFALHRKLAQYIRVPSRRTFLVSGPTGSGKTTLVHFFRIFYDRQTMVFIADFLTYNYIVDIRNKFAELEKYLFERLKSCIRPNLTSSYTTYYQFRAAAAPDSTAQLLNETIRCDVAPSSSYLSEWIESLLFNASSDQLVFAHRACTMDDSSSSHISDSDIVAAQRWKDAIVAVPSVGVVQNLADQYRSVWQSSIIDFLCRQIVNDALHLCEPPADAEPNPRSTIISDVITSLTHQFSINRDDLRAERHFSLVAFTRTMLSQLAARTGSVIVCIDNADRASASLTELAIFTQSWEYLSDRHENVKMLFCVRQETFDRHRTIFEHLDESRAAESVGQHLEHIDTPAWIEVFPPTFHQVLVARLHAVSNRLAAIGAPEAVRRTFTEYLVPVIKDKDLSTMFEHLFGADLRASLKRFETALRSPHITHVT